MKTYSIKSNLQIHCLYTLIHPNACPTFRYLKKSLFSKGNYNTLDHTLIPWCFFLNIPTFPHSSLNGSAANVL